MVHLFHIKSARPHKLENHTEMLEVNIFYLRFSMNLQKMVGHYQTERFGS